MRFRTPLVSILTLLSQFAAGQPAELAHNEFEATGGQTTVMIHRMGRYSFSVSSGSGVAIALLDRMSGTLASDGVEGARDGRVDMMLEPGEYLIRLRGDPNADGRAKLRVDPFERLDTRLLPRSQLITGQLEDLQRADFWIDQQQQGPFHLEVMGRHLDDAFLMISGEWVVDIGKQVATYEPEQGQPMRHIEFFGTLGPGRYHVACFGGAGSPWSNASADRPFVIRWGVTELSANGQLEFDLSDFGRDAFLLPHATRFVQLSRADKTDAVLKRSAYQVGRSRFAQAATARINGESRLPMCALEGQSGDGQQWVIIEAEPGARVALSYLTTQTMHQLDPLKKRYWIGIYQSIEAADALDMTALITHPDEATPVFEKTLLAGSGLPLARRINLTGTVSAFVHVTDPGSYTLAQLDVDDKRCEFSLRPAMLEQPRGSGEPVFKLPGETFDLVPGYHLLTLRPRKKGILSMAFGLSGQVQNLGLGAVQPVNDEPIVIDQVDLPNQHGWYRLWVAPRDGVRVGADVRALPLNITQPIGVPLEPGATRVLDVAVSDPVWLRKPDRSTDVVVGGVPRDDGEIIAAGRSRWSLTNSGDTPLIASLSGEQVPSWSLTQAPRDFAADLPILSTASPVFSEFERNQTQYFILNVDSPSLYRLETSGRLATAVAVRTRMQSALFRESENGTGRNGLIQQYLRPGEYLVTVQTLGRSMGRLGVHLQEQRLQLGEPLSSSEPVRIRLDPNAASAHQFSITEPGPVDLFVFGLGRTFRSRIEDEGQWPVMGIQSNQRIPLKVQPGTYRLISLPETVESRRLIGLEPIEAAVVFQGKGPHPIQLNRIYDHIWRKGDADRYSFHLAARVPVEVELSPGMRMHLRGPHADHRILGGQTEVVDLYEGDCSVAIERLDDDDRFPYRFSLKTETLVAGVAQERSRFPTTIDLAVGSQSALRLWSLGTTDIRVRLVDAQGDSVLEQDDIASDWNIDAELGLAKGNYRLDVQPVGKQHGPVTFELQAREETLLENQDVPFSLDSGGVRGPLRIPFDVSAAGALSVTGCPGQVDVLREGQLVGRGEGSVQVQVQEGPYELRCWCDGESDSEITADIRVPVVVEVTNPRDQVRLEAGLFQLVSSTPTTLWCSEEVAISTPTQPSFQKGQLVDLSSGGAIIQLERPVEIGPLELTADQPIELDGPFSHLSVLPRQSGLVRLDSIGTAVMGPDPKTTDWNGFWLLENEAIAVAGPGQALHVRSAREGAALRRIRARLIVFETQAGKITAPRQLSIPPHSVLRLENPNHEAVQLILPRDVLALSRSAVGDVEVLGGADRAGSWRLPFVAAAVEIWNPTTRDVQVALHPGQPAARDLIDLSSGFEIIRRPQTKRFRIEHAEPSLRLRAVGDTREIRVLGEDGRIWDLNDLPSGRHLNGVLEVPEGGWVFAWQGRDNGAGIWPEDLMVRAIPDRGHVSLTAGVSGWNLSLDHAALIVVRADIEAVFGIMQSSRMLDFATRLSREWSFWADPGDYALLARVPSDAVFGGTAVIDRVTPKPLSDGQGEPRWLPVGHPQAFHFEVERESSIGIGADVAVGEVELELRNAAGAVIAVGPMLYERLPAGTYRVVARCRSPQPAQYAPVLYGRKDVESIPENVLEGFRAGGGL